MVTGSIEMTVFQAIGQFISYAGLAIFAENVVFSRALGVSRLTKLVSDPDVKTWQYCTPVILVQLLSAPAGWAAHNLLFNWIRTWLPAWMPIATLRPVIYLTWRWYGCCCRFFRPGSGRLFGNSFPWPPATVVSWAPC